MGSLSGSTEPLGLGLVGEEETFAKPTGSWIHSAGQCEEK